MTIPRPTSSRHTHDVDDVAPESPQDTISPESPLDTKSPSAHDQTNGHENRNEPNLEKPFSIYTKREKWCMIVLIALAGLF
ncbi:hypothetical protein FRC12_015324, partial [Ceratobasidium sp. 428]